MGRTDELRRTRDRDQRRSTTSFDDAVMVGSERAAQTLRNLRSAWVKEMEVGIDPSSGQINKYQVNLKVVFVLE